MRRSISVLFFLTCTICLCLPATATAARRDEARFDIYLRGIKAGVLALSGSDNGQAYAVAGRLESTGLIGAIVKVRYDAKSKGRITRQGFSPRSYFEKTTGSARNSEVSMTYRSGVPRVERINSSKKTGPNAVDPATQKGTLDPMTTIYGALRDVSRAEVCNYNIRMFDGKRVSRVRLSNPAPRGEGFVCAGEYRRIAGFSDKEMAERQRFPFTLSYDKIGNDLYRVTGIRMITTFGNAVLSRR
ncbi:MAG: DUF3108 domain-containing protein [Pseudomonadota bacterium]